ncbi:MAG: SLBB domain-containing protein [Ignavibacteriales bacterium]|nr:SLBB domain-containing protein [Ignavibacteriales bacterium]
MKKFFILLALLFACVGTNYGQIDQKVTQQLKSKQLYTETEIEDELRKMNMTVDDARKYAKQYGIDYDQFIVDYVMKNKKKSTEVITNVTEDNQPSVRIEIPIDTSKSNKITEVENLEKLKKELIDDISNLPYFGYNIFLSVPQAFEPSAIGPIDPNYLVGPNDVIRIYMWGDVEFSYELTVDELGRVFIPEAGQIFVSGPYSQLQERLTLSLARFYEGLISSPPRVFLDATLAKVKPVRIFALGEVKNPGGYNINGYSEVFNALFSIGGPLTSGSLRDIKVYRNERKIAEVDIYDYLLGKESISDVRLSDNDKIFIPPRLSTIIIDGEILRPAIYELKVGEGLRELLKFSGGLKPTAFTGRAQINRIVPFEERAQYSFDRKIFDVDLSRLLSDPSFDIPLKDGDIIKIFPIRNEVENYISLQGAVYRPGTYDVEKAPYLSNLIEMADGLLPEVYLKKADIIRTNEDYTREFYSVDLELTLRGDRYHDIKLQSRDSVRIYSIYDLKDILYVSIDGYVKTPFATLYADSLTLYDMIFKAGGLQDPVFRGKAFTVRGDVVRLNKDAITTRVIPFDLKDILDERNNMDLEPGDKIHIYKLDATEILEKWVRIEGEVNNPGRYPLDTNMTPLDLIIRAGGYNERALRTEVRIHHIDIEGYPGDRLSEEFNLSIPDISGNINEYNFDNKSFYLLKHKDVVVVKKNPNYEEQRSVKILGEIEYPGTYVLKSKNESVADLIKTAGGPTSEAFLFGSFFVRDNKRVIINLEKLFYDDDDDENINLFDGDSIFIPKKPNTVLVSGEVNNPGLFKFVDGESVKDYINKAGGLTNDADYAVCRQSNGESRRVNFGIFTTNPSVYDGAMIWVRKVPPPEPETEKTDWTGTLRDILTYIVTALTVLVLAKQL